MPVGKKPAQVKRRKIVEEVRRQDAEKKAALRVGVSRPDQVKKPRAGFKNPKPREVEVPCCLDKDRPMPAFFRQCPDCPKEAVSSDEVVAKLTEAGLKVRRGAKPTGVGSKPRRVKNQAGV